MREARVNVSQAARYSALALLLTAGLLAEGARSTSALAAEAEKPATATGEKPAAAASAKTAAQGALNPRTMMTGQWNRYPDMGETPDPKYPPPGAIPPPPLKPQYQAEYDTRRKAVADADAKGQPLYTNYTACLPDGMPAMMMGMFPMEVLQTPGQITIIQEAYNQVRRIYLNESLPAPEDAEPLYWGHSAGRWEGNALVVETIGIKTNVRFRDAPHGIQMRIHERLRLLSPDMME